MPPDSSPRAPKRPASGYRPCWTCSRAALGTQRFYGAASAFVTALATRLACERVSIGFVKGGRARVRAVSHSAHFGKQTNLVRAIGAAMDEAIDQHGTVVYPTLPGRATRVVRAHAELARHGEPGAICTIPLIENRRFVGALTVERPAERPFDAMTIDLCEVLAAVAGPVLEVQRRDDRWLAVKAGDTAWRPLKAVIGPQRTALKLGVVAFAAVVAVLALARGEYRVSARTGMEARTRLAAVAPFAGYIVPLKELDEAETQKVLADLGILEAKENRQIAELDLERARAALGQRTLKSPVTGVVTERLLSPGEFVRGTPIVKLAQIHPLRVEVIAPVALLGKLSPGMTAEVLPESPIGGIHPAKVTVVDRVVDAASGTFGVRLEVPNPNYRLPAGLKCKARFSR